MPTFVDDNGRPDPNGCWQIVDGNRILRPGRTARFSIANFRDSAPDPQPVNDAGLICDAERGCIIAQARAEHRLKTGYLGDRAPEFTDAMAQAAVDRAVQQKRGAAAFTAQYAADTATQMQDAEAARQRGIAGLNDWRR